MGEAGPFPAVRGQGCPDREEQLCHCVIAQLGSEIRLLFINQVGQRKRSSSAAPSPKQKP